MRFIRQHGPLLPFLVIVVLLAGGAVYLAGQLAAPPAQTTITGINLGVTAAPPLGTPEALFGPLDPAIVPYLEHGQPAYGAIPLDALGPNVQPVGAFLPATGNTRFELGQPTPLPTPLPYPTSPPLPLPALPQQILPTVSVLGPDGTPRTLAYAGDGCAPSGLPADGILTQRFHSYHSGVDFGIPLGTPIVATHSGQVTFADWNTFGYGYLVILQNGPFITYYAHLTSFNVSEGNYVGKGSIIAWSGSTGNSSGPHIHYETRINDVPVDPLTFESRGYVSC
ncbi:MAG: M23 family metallopeptidase [Anaerolineaceae bacterium]|nr:M23 family metallopeptidase [Anaerolineaceae bacterium]